MYLSRHHSTSSSYGISPVDKYFDSIIKKSLTHC
nr:MAG TPA: hypothetical protein [Caudoviricetes sp.]